MEVQNVFILKARRCKKEDAHHGPYIIDPSLNTVQCDTCKEKMNPIYVLNELARAESTWTERMNRIREQCAIIEARLRCRCEYCGLMTRIIK